MGNDKQTGSQDAFSANVSERRSFVEGQYESLWQGVAQKFDKTLSSGERDLSRVHLFMRRNFGPDFEDDHLRKKYEQHENKLIQTGYLMDRQLVRVDGLDPRVVTLITDAVKMREAIGAFGPDVLRIVELGSGWGKNLFNLFKFGSPLAAEYWGFELTATGRQLMDRVGAACASDMRLRSSPFDYYDADFSPLKDPATTCVFTHHSVEQIPEIPEVLIDRILAIPGFKLCVHMEPVGFQFKSDKWLHPRESLLMQRIDEDNKRFAEKRNQNKNLYPLLKKLESQGRIKIHTVKKYFTSHLLDNATTVICWGQVSSRWEGAIRRDDLA